jgi:small ligand-binding sensory domain FIST
MSIATGLAAGLTPDPELAAEAVRRALQIARAPLANSVLLFLTSEFAKDPQPALRAASRAASCTQIVGCTAAGIFTDEEWMLDAPAAAAMVFTGDVGRRRPPARRTRPS